MMLSEVVITPKMLGRSGSRRKMPRVRLSVSEATKGFCLSSQQSERIEAHGRRQARGVARLADDVGVEIDGDDQLGAQRAAGGDRQRIDQRAVGEPAPFELDRRKQARQREGGAQRIGEIALLQPDLMAGDEIGGDRDEGNGQRLDPQRPERAAQLHAAAGRP